MEGNATPLLVNVYLSEHAGGHVVKQVAMKRPSPQGVRTYAEATSGARRHVHREPVGQYFSDQHVGGVAVNLGAGEQVLSQGTRSGVAGTPPVYCWSLPTHGSARVQGALGGGR